MYIHVQVYHFLNYVNTYGINEISPLNSLKGFNVTKCFPYDIMHSIFEGVARRHINYLLHYLIDSRGYFKLSDLNHIIKAQSLWLE